jgi:hypothetical protein
VALLGHIFFIFFRIISYTYIGVMYGKDRGEEWTSKDMSCVVPCFVFKI